MSEKKNLLEKLIAVVFLLPLVLLAGCGSDGGTVTIAAPGSGTISGTAIKGPVAGATITAFGLNPDGTMGAQIGEAMTDSQGNFSMDAGNHEGPFMLTMTGGSFTDEATGNMMTTGSGDMMTALIPSMTSGEGVTGIQITPLTSMAQQMAENMAGGMTQVNITQANSAMGHYFGVNDILHTQPMNPLIDGAGAAATQDQRDYGMTMAAVSEYADMIGLSSTTGMVTAMMNDASDGHMDGMMNGNQITMGGGMMGGMMMQSNAGTAGLADAMQAFIESGQNHSGLTVQDMQTLMDMLRNSNGTIQ